jgi:hypothetical protein
LFSLARDPLNRSGGRIMRTSLSILLLSAAATALVAGSAEASTKYVSKVKVVHKVQSCPPPISASVKIGSFGLSLGAPLYPVCPEPVVVARPVYVAPVRYVVDRVYVEPVYSQVCVGYDRCGRPFYRTALIRNGYWRTARYAIQPNGCREFVCYL